MNAATGLGQGRASPSALSIRPYLPLGRYSRLVVDPIGRNYVVTASSLENKAVLFLGATSETALLLK